MNIKNKYDVVIVGGGIAGIAAAVKSARMGASTILIEQYAFVGGMSTAGMVSPFMKHSINGEPLVRGVFEEIEVEMRKNNGMIDNGFYASSFRNSAYTLLKNSGADLLLNTTISKVNRNENHIESVLLQYNSSPLTINGKVFIDTSGDAQLTFLGNFPWIKGDEKTGLLQALTLFFRMGNIDIPKALKYVQKNKSDFFDWMEYDFDLSKIISVAGYFSIVKSAIDQKRLSPEVEYIFYTTLPESGEASFNTSNVLGLDGSSSEDLTEAEFKGRKQVADVVKILQNEIPGFENSILIETAVQVGVRETRRTIGEYSVTGDDIRKGAKFTDSIARGCYGVDIHGQKDEESVMEDLEEGQFYEIPLRSLLVKDSLNLLAAGRCISSTREGHGALRIMPTSAATGEACGALAALAVKNRKLIRDIEYTDLVNQLRGNV
jgi:hypothetical protein